MKQSIESFFQSISGKRIALIGMGRSHMPLIPLFTKYGATVIACDKRDEAALGEIAEKAKADGALLSLGEHYLDDIDVDIALRTPGMRFYCDELNALREKGVVISSEMEIFFDICPCRIFAVTGSDGKTTTTTVISEMLKKQGYTVHIGGNIGKPLLPEIETIRSEDVCVVELSSFQLISMRQSPDTAVVTNLAPNHLDIHKDMQEYIDSKKNIILYQNKDNKAVLNLDNEITASFAPECKGEVVYFSRRQAVERGAYLDGNTIIYTDGEKKTEVLDIRDIKIPGMHNVENYMTAICAVWGVVDVENIVYVARNFGGVEHRAEFVRELDGVKYYNDSIASSPTRTASGTLSLYDFKIILIAGGYDKHLDYTELGDVICKKVKTAILMGATADKIETAIRESKSYSENNPLIIRVKDMAEAVQAAREHAQSGDIVSMSPASASFDLYKDFDARGKHFKALVNAL
ncbi:UDP-N-acetylmuramoyl-L-alanine--D-glutamate ligase [uncultured Ruminococcus sp.]|uniref:UDP-N-acetylmuramoyl-L-alanine--D-glutamate ligase n=1 Tax=uncultured Ruminococcus sp. TaxID=165186 RepID=UPI00292F9ECA|nr:UDP-N-acetylmuramoyl-L-alanine--D-glutamate ligase [uncultured Ruminococcus sp.]